jgi:hypothetical protein
MRARAWTLTAALMVLVIIVILMAGVYPGKPVAKSAAEPGLIQLETHELGSGFLHVLRNNQTGELVGVYVLAGRDPVIAVMGGAAAR